MKHVKAMTQGPARAQDASIGQILVVVAEIMSVIGSALAAKENVDVMLPDLNGGDGDDGNNNNNN